MYHMPRHAHAGDPIGKYTIAYLIKDIGTCNDPEGLAAKIRSDTSFDIAVPNSPVKGSMGVELKRHEGRIPIFTQYSGDAIAEAVVQLPYAKEHQFSPDLPTTVSLPHFILNFIEDIALYDALDIIFESLSIASLDSDRLSREVQRGMTSRRKPLFSDNKFLNSLKIRH